SAGIPAMHQFEDPAAAALDWNMGASNQLRKRAIHRDQIVAITFGMRRSKPNPFEPLDFVHRLEQLNKGRLAVLDRDLAFPVTGHDLTQQGDFLYPARDQFPALAYDVFERSAAFLAAGVRHDAESAVLIAALHDADIRSDRSLRVPIEQMLTDCALAPFFRRDIDNFFAMAAEDFVQVLGGAMELLRPDDKVHV